MIFDYDYMFLKQILVYFLLGGFTIILALAWNTAFTNMIQKYVPNKHSNVSGQFLYAFILTIVFVVISSTIIDKNMIRNYYNISKM